MFGNKHPLFLRTESLVHLSFQLPVLSSYFPSGYQFWALSFLPVTSFELLLSFRLPLLSSKFPSGYRIWAPSFLPVTTFWIPSFLPVTIFQLPTITRIYRKTHFSSSMLQVQICSLHHNDQKKKLYIILKDSFWWEGPFNLLIHTLFRSCTMNFKSILQLLVINLLIEK